jgi:hypothetical protein
MYAIPYQLADLLGFTTDEIANRMDAIPVSGAHSITPSATRAARNLPADAGKWYQLARGETSAE